MSQSVRILCPLIILFVLAIGLTWMGCGEEDDSTDLPPQPINLQATVKPNHVYLEWKLSEPNNNRLKFNVYRRIASENESRQIANTEQPSYQDFSVISDTSYFYYISTTRIEKDQKFESRISEPIRIDFFQPKLIIEPAQINLVSSETNAKFRLQNQGLAILNWSIEKTPDWLSTDISGGFINPSQSETVVVTIVSGLKPDLYQSNLQIDVTGSGPVILPVLLEITAEPKIWLSNQEIQFGYNDDSKDLVLKNSGTGILDWTIISPENWLIVEPSRGQIEAETKTVKLSVDRSVLPSGMTSIQLTLSTSNGQVLPISVNIGTSRPILALSANELDFGFDSQRKTIILRNEGLVDLSWRLTPPRPRWLQTIPSRGMLPPKSSTEVGLIFDRSWVPAGQHNFEVEFSPSPSTDNFPSQSLRIFAQRKGQIFGLVKDSRTGRSLANAEIYLPPYREKSKSDGKFVLPFDNEGQHKFNITADRYIGRGETIKTTFGEAKVVIDLSPVPKIDQQIMAGKHISHPIRIAFSANSIYVTNQRNHSHLTVVDSTGVVSSLHLNEPEILQNNEHPVGIAITKDKICLALSDIDKVSIVSADDSREVHRFTVGDYPVDCVVSDDGRWLYVSLQRENRIAVVDLEIPARVQRIVVGAQPNRLLIKDGILYVCNYGDATVSVIDLSRRIEVLRIRVGQLPTSLSIAHNGRYLYVVNSLSDDLSIIDLNTHREIARPQVSVSPVAVSSIREPNARELVYVGNQNGSLQIYEVFVQHDKLELIPRLRLNTNLWIQDMKYNPNQEKLVVLGRKQITIFGYD